MLADTQLRRPQPANLLASTTEKQVIVRRRVTCRREILFVGAVNSA